MRTRRPANTTPARRRPPGFSLIEVLVVIAIIALLIAIAIPAATAIRSQAKRSATQATLQGALGVETELRAKRGAFLISTNTTLAPAASTPYRGVEIIVEQANADADARKMVNALTLEDTDGDGVEEILDAWGTPLAYYAGLPHDRASAGTPPAVVTTSGSVAAFPASRTPVFVSAGPDQAFGIVNPTNNSRTNDEAEDDLWSFELE